MSANSKIEWCDHTFNPWIGCTKVSPGCANCYAESMMDRRYGKVKWGKGKDRHPTSENYWKQPIAWNRTAICTNCGYAELIGSDDCRKCGRNFSEEHRRRPRVFCASLADVFDPEVPDEWRCALFDTITETPNLDWLILSKRPEIAHDFYHNKIGLQDETIRDKFLPNVWLGVSVEDQKRADERIPLLLEIPAKIRFLSCEPLLGPVNLERPLPGPDLGHEGSKICQPWMIQGGIDWVICGGESGHGARPMHPDWARSLRDQCVAAGVAFFFKQWGEFVPGKSLRNSSDVIVSNCSERGVEDFIAMQRVGKKRAGRILDGREWNEFPKATMDCTDIAKTEADTAAATAEVAL